MGTITTRFILRSNNTFRNQISQRHDRTVSVENKIESITRVIKENSGGSPYTLLDGADWYDSTESGATANQIMVFIRNTTSTAAKTITVQFNKNGTRDGVILLGPGEYTMFPWLCDAATDDIEVFSNDATNGVKIELLATPMK